LPQPISARATLLLRDYDGLCVEEEEAKEEEVLQL
jgi:hypothetical protein